MSDVQTAVPISDEQIELYALGELEPEDTSIVESHLSECQPCRERFSQTMVSQLSLHQISKAKSKEKYKRSEPRFSAGYHAVLQELSPLSLDRQTLEIVDCFEEWYGHCSAEIRIFWSYCAGPNQERRRASRGTALFGIER
jgi:hypothetical protein